MSLITCPECDQKISDRAQTCPKCGLPFADKQLKKDSYWKEKINIPRYQAFLTYIIAYCVAYRIFGPEKIAIKFGLLTLNGPTIWAYIISSVIFAGVAGVLQCGIIWWRNSQGIKPR